MKSIICFTSLLALVLVVNACSPTAAPTLTSPTFIGAAPTQPSQSSAPSQTSAPASSATLVVTSDAFTEGGNIPKKFSCDGDNVSPKLKWSGAPAGTKSFALIVDDPDAPVSGGFVHWVLFDVPTSQTELPEGAKNIGKPGNNGTGRSGYTGPCPPSGTHRYFFKLYALDVATLNLKEGATREQVLAATNGHVLAQGSLMGRYGR
jgi:Raf kinase inhibitor-like YbhB/YbcL family protein